MSNVNDNQRFKAKIGNKNYTFVGKSSFEHMKTVTDLMNNQLEQIKDLSPSISNEDASILLAFNAISDQLKMQKKLNKMTENNDDKENKE
ncbi:cell division protein ZapA [Apilactobacillus sp. TMW 2.2459]|uniref:cell division protein ZapA n=1 Tax=Apilactobacillus xinyiensis TaxID=2841032 RepID=UPI001C7D80AE|nr:cell division protein ZapA [Apilactobacillus xinyiensis]MCL0312335.1 cell division protein ZapA [Apilactobacillus xinyiensis]